MSEKKEHAITWEQIWFAIKTLLVIAIIFSLGWQIEAWHRDNVDVNLKAQIAPRTLWDTCGNAEFVDNKNGLRTYVYVSKSVEDLVQCYQAEINNFNNQ